MGGALRAASVAAAGLVSIGCGGAVERTGDALITSAVDGPAAGAPIAHVQLDQAPGATGSLPDGASDDGTPTGGPGAGSPPGYERDDGRPSWWFPEIRRGHGRVTICTEVLARDIRSARTFAVESAALRITGHATMGADAPVEIDRVLVLPLPRPAANGAAYVGYAQASAPE